MFAVGLNDNGQLGHGDLNTRTAPTAVPLPSGHHVTGVAAGGANSVLLLGRTFKLKTAPSGRVEGFSLYTSIRASGEMW